MGAVTVSVLVVDLVAVVADSVLVTVTVFDVAVLLEVAPVAASAVVVVFGVVGGADAVVVVGVVCDEDSAVVVWLFVRVVVEADASVGEAGRLALAVLLVIWVRVFEMPLAMLDAPPEPHPATGTVRMPDERGLEQHRPPPLTLIALGLRASDFDGYGSIAAGSLMCGRCLVYTEIPSISAALARMNGAGYTQKLCPVLPSTRSTESRTRAPG